MIYSNLVLILFILINLFFLINFSKIKIFNLNIDNPDKKRKFHSKPTPLAGGQLIFFNILLYWLIYTFADAFLDKEVFFEDIKSFNYFMLISTCIFLLGFTDDRINLKANLKFLIMILLIFFLLLLDKNIIINEITFSFYQKNISLDEFAIFFSIFCFLVFINAFNMFDGINLQSGIYSLIILISILVLYSNSLLIKVLIISLIFFLYLNFKNKTFLGDSGSLLISFIISYLFINLYNSGFIEYADNITLYMIVPGLDLIRLFIIRIINKKNPLTSDRNHLHHILIKKYTFGKTLIIIFLLVSLPLILNFFRISNLVTIIVTVLVYSFLVRITSKDS
jgi:UDP-GlcNAc:undecaprenyl-phosphate/decaprenyl-phosphate GlcNAc-1-phosphate transferase